MHIDTKNNVMPLSLVCHRPCRGAVMTPMAAATPWGGAAMAIVTVFPLVASIVGCSAPTQKPPLAQGSVACCANGLSRRLAETDTLTVALSPPEVRFIYVTPVADVNRSLRDYEQHCVEQALTAIEHYFTAGLGLKGVSRRHMRAILDEQAFQLGVVVDEAKAVALGRILPADYVINSSMTFRVHIDGVGGRRYMKNCVVSVTLEAAALDVTTGEIVHHVTLQADGRPGGCLRRSWRLVAPACSQFDTAQHD